MTGPSEELGGELAGGWVVPAYSGQWPILVDSRFSLGAAGLVNDRKMAYAARAPAYQAHSKRAVGKARLDRPSCT